MHDLAIIGSGPAAMSAALYAGRAGLKVRVFEAQDFGGTLPKIDRIENYPGFAGTGAELSQAMRIQAESAGAKFVYGKCSNIDLTTDAFTVPDLATQNGDGEATATDAFTLTIDDDERVRARAVLIATGSEPKSLRFVPNRPVSYCALCDGPLTAGKHVVVVGGANSAVQEALYLAGLAADVTIVTHSQLKADRPLLDRLANAKNIQVREQTEPTPDLLNQFDHIFVYIGKRPATGFLRPLADSLLSATPLLSPDGYVITSSAPNPIPQRTAQSISPAQTASSVQPTSPARSSSSTQSSASASQPAAFAGQARPYQTIVSGLFAAGDVRQGSTKQVITAAAEGAAAAIAITQYLQS